MKSNYRRIGDFIRLVNNRNKDLLITDLRGISMKKEFRKSTSNIIGTDLSKYKIVAPGQFTCDFMSVIRVNKFPVVLNTETIPIIVSPAYPVFEIIDENILLSDYLMMWFRRTEFDRYSYFKCDSAIRGGFGWDELCEAELPVPSIERQQEIVDEYHTIEHRIRLNEELSTKLEQTAQAVYRQWFVDFEFPDEQDNPYKSGGGAMVWNEELEKEIPVGWKVGRIPDLAQIVDGDRGVNYPSQSEFTDSGFCLFLNAGNVSKDGFNFQDCAFINQEKDKILKKGKLERNDVILTSRGTVGNIAFYSVKILYSHIRINSGMVIFRPKDVTQNSIYLYLLFKSKEMKRNIENYLSGSAQPQLPIRDIQKIPVLIPNLKNTNGFQEKTCQIILHKDSIYNQILELNQLSDILLSKMTKE